MKKYFIVLIMILSITLSYFTYKNYNSRLFSNYNQYQDYIALVENKQTIPLILDIDHNNKQFMNQFIQSLIKFSKNQYTFTFAYSNYDDVTEISCFSLYTQNKNTINDLKERSAKEINFELNDQGYYSTDINDHKAIGHIEILDNSLFDEYNTCIRIYSIKDSINDLGDKKELVLYFYVDSVEEFDNEFITFLKNNHFDDKVSFENLYGGYSEAKLELISIENMKEIFLLIIYVAFVYILYLFIYYSKKKKTILIQRLHGISQVRIICKEVIPLLLLHYVIFVVVNLICMYLFTQGRMFYEQGLLNEIGMIFLCLAVIFIIVILGVYLLVRLFISIKSLKASSYSSKNIIYIMIIKIVVLSLLSGPMIQMISECYDAGVSYYYINCYYDKISKLSYIDGNMKKLENNNIVFDYYSHKDSIYCDFDTYYNNTLDRLKEVYEDIDEDQLNEQTLDFPVIYVNANYIKAMGQRIYTKNGKELELDKFDKDKMLVPSQYMSGRLENVLINGSQIQGEIETIEIKDTGTYLNYGLKKPYTLTNPVIYLVTQKNDYCQMQNFYIPYSQYISKEIYDLTNEKVDLKSCQTFLDNELRDIKDDFIHYGFITGLYLSVYIGLLYQSVFWFVEEYKKLLMIEYILGKSSQERYKQLYIMNSIVYIIPFIMNVFIEQISFISIIELYVVSMIIEICVMNFILRRIEKTSVSIVLKGDYGL